MDFSIYKKHQFQNSLWSGGSTTQLYISPAEASYSERNFDVRISTAKVEQNESTFTLLPRINRKLMILEGEIHINHQNQYSKHLKQFDVDSFKGDWITTAFGTCTDFNVMTSVNKQSELFCLQIPVNNKLHIKLDTQWNTLCLYIIKGSLQIEVNQTNHTLEQGDFIVIKELTKFIFPIQSNKKCEISVVKIR